MAGTADVTLPLAGPAANGAHRRRLIGAGVVAAAVGAILMLLPPLSAGGAPPVLQTYTASHALWSPGSIIPFISSRGAAIPPSVPLTPAAAEPAPSLRPKGNSAALLAAAGAPDTDGRLTLFDTPVSNNGARVRLVVYWKGLEDRVALRSPAEVGGLKSAAYLAVNPQGKMPALLLPDGTALPESEVIVQFLIDSFLDVGPRLTGDTPLERAHIRLMTRYHDLYIGPVQGAMYKAMGPEERRSGLQQIQILEERANPTGPFLAGGLPSTADAALFPTFVFISFILPRHFAWADVFDGCPKLRRWFAAMTADPAGARVRAEVEGGLEGWEAAHRWDSLGITEQVQAAGGAFAPPFA